MIGIGTATFMPNYGLGAGAPPGDALLRRAAASGIGYFDTAADYADSETAVGRAVPADRRVCTKIKSGEGIDAVHASVNRLGRTPDTILMHSAGQAQLESASAIAALQTARERGFVRRIGASTYGVEDARFALAQPWVDAVQVEYSILNQSVIRGLERRRPGQEVVVRSVLCKGLLTSRRSEAPRLTAGIGDALAGIEACAQDWGQSIEALAIRFALGTPGVDVVVVGVSNDAELEVALDASRQGPLTSGQWQRLAAFDRSDVDAAHPERWSQVS